MTTTPLELPQGRIYYEDAINAQYYGIYSDKYALMLGIIADPSYFGASAKVIRFEESESLHSWSDPELWVTYTTCDENDNSCTLDRMASDMATAELTDKGIAFTKWNPEFTEAYHKAYNTLDEDNIEPVPADCESVDKIEYKHIEIGVIVK